jgi:hypothetical protein
MYIRQSALCGLTAHIRGRSMQLKKKKQLKENHQI